MKYVFLLLMMIGLKSPFAHDGHGPDLKSLPAVPGTSIFHLQSEWKNQKGNSVKLTSLQGNARLVVMLFTKCETACPLIVEDLKELADDLTVKGKSAPIDVSIFSLDSSRETPETLSAFAKKRKLPAHWQLHTSTAGAVAELAAALGVRYKRLPNGDFIHSNVIYFLSHSGEILAKKEGIKSPRKEFVKEIEKYLKVTAKN